MINIKFKKNYLKYVHYIYYLKKIKLNFEFKHNLMDSYFLIILKYNRNLSKIS